MPSRTNNPPPRSCVGYVVNSSRILPHLFFQQLHHPGRAAAAGADNGYVMKISASGSQGTIVMMVGVDADKAITGISVVSHSETSGIGTKVVGNEPNAAGEPVLDQFIGESGAGSLVVGKNIIAVSGATVSTKGINMGANAALAVAELLG